MYMYIYIYICIYMCIYVHTLAFCVLAPLGLVQAKFDGRHVERINIRIAKCPSIELHNDGMQSQKPF